MSPDHWDKPWWVSRAVSFYDGNVPCSIQLQHWLIINICDIYISCSLLPCCLYTNLLGYLVSYFSALHFSRVYIFFQNDEKVKQWKNLAELIMSCKSNCSILLHKDTSVFSVHRRAGYLSLVNEFWKNLYQIAFQYSFDLVCML